MNLALTSNFKMKRYGTTYFLYDSLKGNLIKVGTEIAETINKLLHENNFDRYGDKLLPLVENGLLQIKENAEHKVPPSLHSVGESYNLRFHVSNRCNQNCCYCHVYNGGRTFSNPLMQMDYRILKMGLDTYAKLTEGKENQALEFRFYGGEPLFNWLAIKKAICYGNSLLQEQRKVTWILNTNGTMITHDRAKTLLHENVDVHLSIDGPDNISNQNRLYKSGRPVLKRVLNALDMLGRVDCKVQFDSCLTAANRHQLTALVDLAADRGVQRIYLSLTDEKPLLNTDFMSAREIAKLLISTMAYGEQKGVVVGGPWKRFEPWILPKTKSMAMESPRAEFDNGYFRGAFCAGFFRTEIGLYKPDSESSRFQYLC